MINRRTRKLGLDKYCRYPIAFLGNIGFIITTYLTITKLSQSSTVCPTEGCEIVLSSPYAEINGIPLSLFGSLAYLSVIILAILPLVLRGRTQRNLQEQTQILLAIATTVMTVTSGYLLYLLIFILKTFCLYCLISIFLSFCLFGLSLLGLTWEDIGNAIFTITVVGIISFVGVLGWHSNVNTISVSSTEKVALAQHLEEIGAKMYGAFWCGHCQEQKKLFGKEAFSFIDYIECDPQGENAQANLCQEAGIA